RAHRDLHFSRRPLSLMVIRHTNQAVRLWMNGKGTGTVQKRCLSFLQTEEKNHGKNYCHYAIFGVLLKKVIYYKEEEHV
uniref:hypothetical protein n=1 Tax=Mediterraneibacter gnavus TaxID=33038 RepID=UPI00402A4701